MALEAIGTQPVDRKLAAIVAADVAGYSRLMGADEEGTLQRLKTYERELINPKITEHHGRVVKTTGDGFLIEFLSVVEAVRCAVEIQQAMAQQSAEVPQGQRIEFRMGINLGDVITDGDDIYDDGVNIAARLESLAEPGGLCISRAVRDHIRDRMPLSLTDMGRQSVKNIARPVRAFRVRLDPQPMVPGNFGQADRTRALLAAAGALLIVLATSAIYYLGREAQSTNAPSGRDPQVPSIAVLPFLNLSGDSEQEYFVDGLTEDLITDLSNLSGLLVIARNSSFTYKNQVVKAQQVAKELHVAYVLNGSVRRAAGRVRITAELTDAASKRQILAQRYDRELTDIFAVQDEVKKEIVSALAVKLEPSEQSRTVVKPTNSIEAYERIVSDP